MLLFIRGINQCIRLKKNWVFRICVTLILSIILFVCIKQLFFHYNKEFYLKKINSYLQSEVNSGLKIGDIRLANFGFNLNTEIAIENILLVDSLYLVHHIKTIDIPQAIIRLNLSEIVKQKFLIKKIEVKDAKFNLFDLPNGYTNQYLFSSKDSSKKSTSNSKFINNVEQISILNTRINIDQKDIYKQFEFLINRLDIYPNKSCDSMKIPMKLDAIVKHLTFKTANGSYGKDAHIKTKLIVEINDSLISFPKSDFLINKTPYKVSAMFGITSSLDTIDLRLESKAIDYKSTITLLAPNISTLLSKMNYENPITAKAVIVGHFSDYMPVIRVDFNMKNCKVFLPFMNFDTLSLSGYYFDKNNRLDSASDENSIIHISNLEGKNEYTNLQAKNIDILNLIFPSVKLDYVIKGDVRGLNNFMPKKEVMLVSGNYRIEGIYDNDLNFTLQKILNVKGEFQFDKIKAWVPKYKYWFDNFNCSARYKENLMAANILNFELKQNLNGVQKLEFYSDYSIFDFRKKFKIYSKFKAKSSPEIFTQFTTKYDFEPKNGIIEFEGVFDDYLEFDIDNFPNINGKLTLKNMDVVLTKYPIKLIKTNADIDVFKSKAKVNQFEVNLIDKSDNNLAHAVQFSSIKSDVDISSQPILHSQFKIESGMYLFDALLKKKGIESDKGHVTIFGNYNGKIQGTYENLERLNSKFLLKNVSLNFKYIDLRLVDIHGELTQSKWDIDIPKLDARYKEYKIRLALNSRDLAAFWLGLKPTTHSNLSIYSPRFNLKTLEEIQQNMTQLHIQDTNNSSLFFKNYNQYNHISGNVFINFDTLNYQQYSLKKFELILNKMSNYTQLNKCQFNIAEGTADILASMEYKDNKNTVNSSIIFNNLSLKYLKQKVPNLLPLEYQNVDLNGQVNLNSQAQFDINMNDEFKSNSLNATTIIDINNLSVKRYASVFNNKVLQLIGSIQNHIEIKPFSLQINTSKDNSRIQKTLVKSNIGDYWLEGNANLKGSYGLKLYFPFYNFSNLILNRNLSKDSFNAVKNKIKFDLKK